MPLKRARLKISDYNASRKSRINKAEKRAMVVNLSLTSMVDMFALIVIFLLANQGKLNEWVKLGHGIQLPKAHEVTPPPRAASLQISLKDVYGNNKRLMSYAEILHSSRPVLNWLRKIPKIRKAGDAYINIVADRKIPFGVIKRVVADCQSAGFGNVNLAVQPR